MGERLVVIDGHRGDPQEIDQRGPSVAIPVAEIVSLQSRPGEGDDGFAYVRIISLRFPRNFRSYVDVEYSARLYGDPYCDPWQADLIKLPI